MGNGEWGIAKADPGRGVVQLHARAARSTHSLFPIPHFPPPPGFSLVELLVAVAVFAALAAAAYGGLAVLARTRAALAAEQDRFAQVVRAVGALERDLRQSIGRPVRDGGGQLLPALAGDATAIEFTRLGHANPLAETRSQLERVAYAPDGADLRRAHYLVLDRAPGSLPVTRVAIDDAGGLRLRYLGCDRVWHDAWPPRERPACEAAADREGALPRAVEFRIAPAGLGEIRRVVELPSSLPAQAAP